MEYKLIKPTNSSYSALEQVLTNRGIDFKDIQRYINTTDDEIYSPLGLGEECLRAAATALIKTIQNNQKAVIIIDSDCDGFTSSALLINYIYELFPSWVENKLSLFMHSGKQHGLSDCIEYIRKNQFPLVICPDSASNDIKYIDEIREYGGTVIVLDHHEVEHNQTEYIIINNQLSNYPNKQLSGVGVTWQFCRYLDNLLNISNANNYLDLVALGNSGDMMSLTSFETKHLINKGFKAENIHNPFIYGMWQQNKFKLGNSITSWGAVFYIVPFVNAIVRSGTQEEKALIFSSMLKHKAFNDILSTKRGHKLGETEQLLTQAIRTCINVKNRQTRAQDAGMAFLEGRIEKNNMLENKVLLFLINPGEIDKNIAGLCANKIMAKYQRPCCILTRVEEDNNISYQGSARGCDKVGVTNFKDICAETGLTLYESGHQGAFGLGIPAENLENFISATNEILKDMPDEAIYYVDYIFDGKNVNPQHILDIGEMDSYWGKDVDESLVAIERLKITNDMINLMAKEKNPTLKISLPNGVSLIKFGIKEEEYESLLTDGYIELNVVGKCNINEWLGKKYPQIMIEEYEKISYCKYLF